MTENPSVPPPPPPGGGSYTPPPPPPPPGAGAPPPGGSSDRTLMLALSYIYFLGIVPLIAKKDDREVKWHAMNGLLLFAAYFLVSIVWWVLQVFVLDSVGCGLGMIVTLISCGISIGYIVIFIMAIMKAIRGERMRFPVISDMADKA
ncbi:MAG: DUF4870 domain-containing protein [Thermoanaerobaculia bacterium]